MNVVNLVGNLGKDPEIRSLTMAARSQSLASQQGSGLKTGTIRSGITAR